MSLISFHGSSGSIHSRTQAQDNRDDNAKLSTTISSLCHDQTKNKDDNHASQPTSIRASLSDYKPYPPLISNASLKKIIELENSEVFISGATLADDLKLRDHPARSYFIRPTTRPGQYKLILKLYEPIHTDVLNSTDETSLDYVTIVVKNDSFHYNTSDDTSSEDFANIENLIESCLNSLIESSLRHVDAFEVNKNFKPIKSLDELNITGIFFYQRQVEYNLNFTSSKQQHNCCRQGNADSTSYTIRKSSIVGCYTITKPIPNTKKDICVRFCPVKNGYKILADNYDKKYKELIFKDLSLVISEFNAIYNSVTTPSSAPIEDCRGNDNAV